MNGPDIATGDPLVAPDNTDALDFAVADLDVAQTFAEAATNFLDGIRSLLGASGRDPDGWACKDINHAQTMIAEIQARISKADDRLRSVYGLVGAKGA